MYTDVSVIWNEISKKMEIELESLMFNTWIGPLQGIYCDSKNLILYAPNKFIKQAITQQFMEPIKKHFRYLMKLNPSDPVMIQIIEPSDPKFQDLEPSPEEMERNSSPTEEEKRDSKLNPSFTFDQFICGKNNEFALASAKIVAESPATAFNPFFIWGGVGLGKTHLMQACAHYIKDRNPYANVVYFTAEQFANELIQKIQYSQMDEFRSKYRNVDVLLVDDIQFIAGKKSTQEEFFNTFNELHSLQKQIIITSDKPPHEMETLEERLQSRFKMGLISGVSPPDYEVRMAILKQMAENNNYYVPDEILDYIATRFTTDIRELKGALLNIMAHTKVIGNPITLDFVKDFLTRIYQKDAPEPITVEKIQKEVTKTYGISMEELLSKSRTQNIAFPRQVAMYISRELTDLSLPKIADAFHRDHTTIMHGVDKIQRLMRKDEAFAIEMQKLIQRIQS